MIKSEHNIFFKKTKRDSTLAELLTYLNNNNNIIIISNNILLI